MTGTGDDVIFSMMSRVELTRPPGVFISMSRAWALRRWASSMARAMYSALMGWMVSSTLMVRAWAWAEFVLRHMNATERIKLRSCAIFACANSGVVHEEFIGPSLRSG